METHGGNGRLDQDLVDICFGIGLSVKTTAWVVRDSVDRVWQSRLAGRTNNGNSHSLAARLGRAAAPASTGSGIGVRFRSDTKPIERRSRDATQA